MRARPRRSTQALTHDFKERRLEVSHYALRSAGPTGAHVPYLPSWVLGVSADRDDWLTVDAREKEKDLGERSCRVDKLWGN
jgi:hypothetical protein